MFQDPTFIIVEGLLSEGGDFELLRGYEDAYAEARIRTGRHVRDVCVSLLDEHGAVLAHVNPEVRLPLTCTPLATRPGAGLLRAAVARSAHARQVQVSANGRVLYTGTVAGERPLLRDVEAFVSDTTITVSFVTADPTTDVRLVAQLTDGRHIGAAAERAGSKFLVDARTLEGLGTAQFVVEATAGFRTARSATNVIALPPPRVHGWIVEPAAGRQWPFGWRGSLVANVSDGRGRQLPWSGVSWVVDGKPLAGNAHLVAWQPPEPGEHAIQLVHDDGNGPTAVLDEVKVTVLPQTQEQKAYEDLIAARSARRTAVKEAAHGSPALTVQETTPATIAERRTGRQHQGNLRRQARALGRIQGRNRCGCSERERVHID